jgi:hypothetical protein
MPSTTIHPSIVSFYRRRCSFPSSRPCRLRKSSVCGASCLLRMCNSVCHILWIAGILDILPRAHATYHSTRQGSVWSHLVMHTRGRTGRLDAVGEMPHPKPGPAQNFSSRQDAPFDSTGLTNNTVSPPSFPDLLPHRANSGPSCLASCWCAYPSLSFSHTHTHPRPYLYRSVIPSELNACNPVLVLPTLL